MFWERIALIAGILFVCMTDNNPLWVQALIGGVFAFAVYRAYRVWRGYEEDIQ